MALHVGTNYYIHICFLGWGNIVKTESFITETIRIKLFVVVSIHCSSMFVKFDKAARFLIIFLLLRNVIAAACSEVVLSDRATTVTINAGKANYLNRAGTLGRLLHSHDVNRIPCASSRWKQLGRALLSLFPVLLTESRCPSGFGPPRIWSSRTKSASGYGLPSPADMVP